MNCNTSAPRVSLVMTSRSVGGLQRSVLPYAAALSAHGHPVQVIMHRQSPLIPHIPKDISIARVSFPRRPLPLSLIQALEVRRHINAFGSDVVLGFASMGYPVARMAMRRSLPILTRCGSMEPRTVGRLLGADHLIATSEEMSRLAVNLGMDAKRVTVLPNFLDTSVRQRSVRRPGPLRIGSLGRFVPRKGFALLIDAASRLQQKGHDFELIIAGDGPDRAQLTAQAASLGVPVRFDGWIDEAAKSAFFNEIDIFACPSSNEPFGFVHLESMQAGLPIVTTDTVGARAIFGGTDAAIIVPGEAGALAEGLAVLLSSPERRQELSRASELEFSNRFSLLAIGSVLSGLVKKVVAEHNT